MGLPLKTHFATALEELALKASPEGYLRFHKLPHRMGSDFNFNNIMIHYFNIIHKSNLSTDDLPDLCASAQFTVTAHLCKALSLVFEYVEKEKIFLTTKKTLIVSGGVAANKYIRGCITKVSEYYGFNTCFPPPKLCTDNAEMIAWLGLELLETNPQCVIRAKDIPINASMPPLRIEDRWPIGIDIRNELPQMSEKRLKASSIHGSTPLIFYFKPKEKDVEIESEIYEKSASLIDC
uniref:Gcp-like domain-containing protein n=1 Tax=Acrobeloides nanus TaxID=290746 RepID=A0A914BV94_9BILA